MKKETLFTRIIGSMLIAVLALLGFSSCSETDGDDNMVYMYGTPQGEFQISGLVTDEEGEPLDSARVISRWFPYSGNDLETENGYAVRYADTAYTDSKGHYNLENKHTTNREVMMVVQDPKGGYESTFKTVKLEYKGGDGGWNIGKAEATANFTLKKRLNDRD